MQLDKFKFEYKNHSFSNSIVIHADCLEWMSKIPKSSIHAIVTDPPYGLKEYDLDQLQKMENGNGGIWRLPPSFDGNERSPLPRFTALSKKERNKLRKFFTEWSKLAVRVLKPGGHVFIASNTILSNLVFSSIIKGGLEYRATIVRKVRTLRGGDRPKNSEEEYKDVCTLPRGCYEPWGLFRKPIPKKMRVSDCLNKYSTGGIRRKPDGNPFEDIINSERTPKNEKELANHPTLKPQSFLRQIVYASLPLGEGILVDPFMGSGSTIAAAEAIGYESIGIERYDNYFEMSVKSIPNLADIKVDNKQLKMILT